VMFKRFVNDSREVVKDARDIASGLESPTLEAEHLLLAVAHRPGTAAQRALAESGLDYEQIENALEAEFEGTLATVGVSLGDFDLRAASGHVGAPRWGTSAKIALQRAAKIADTRRDRGLTPGHIALGVLRAPEGTVPRALDRAGMDRGELGRRVAAAL
jgi:ATP-dependent Clp protease ATP-binding subunit ClpA